MKTLSSPVDLAKESLKIFFEKKNMIYFFKVYSVVFALSLLSFFLGWVISYSGRTNELWWVTIIPSILLFPIGIWSQASGYEAVKRVVSRGKLEFKDTFKSSWKYLWKFLMVNLLFGLVVVGGLLLLIIPGVIFSVWFAFSLWGVVDKNFAGRTALSASKKLVAGQFWKVAGRLLTILFFVVIVSIGFSIIPVVGPLVTTIFGGLFLLPYYLLYRELQ